jgi:transcription initiation factor TFIIIB Brf1 subunit/transcription initiation factor TFIIB
MSCLEDLHNAYLARLPDSEKMEYLLNSVTFLSEQDVTGWKTRFQPEALTESNCGTTTTDEFEPKKKKRRRIAPSAVLLTPYPACIECKSEEIVEDQEQGRVVCISCGMIQVTQLMGTTSMNMTFDQLKNGPCTKIHYYSRVVYFRSVLMGMQALTKPQISEKELSVLRATCDGESSQDVNAVARAIRKAGMASRFYRHRYTITRMLFPSYEPLYIKARDFIDILKFFTRIEFNYIHMKDKMGGRRSFFSYPYVFYQICYHMDVMQYTGEHHLLKDVKLLTKLHQAYKPIAEASGMNYDVSVFPSKQKKNKKKHDSIIK